MKTCDDQKAKEYCHNLVSVQGLKQENKTEYTRIEALVLANFIAKLRENTVEERDLCFVQQYFVGKGLKIFGQDGVDGMKKELLQMHQRTCFEPILIKDLTKAEREKAQEALAFISQKESGEVKGRMVYNGKPTREWFTKESVTSPTVTTEGVFLTAAIDAKQKRDIMSNDVPNAFIQAEAPKGKEKIVMKITGVLVDLLIDVCPETYKDFVVLENGKRVIYVVVLRAIYGMLQAALLWYQKFKSDLEKIGFNFSPYDGCVATRTVNGKQHTIRFHVDDILSSHVDPRVNDKFEKWLVRTYGKIGKVKTRRGKVHDYLGMEFDFTKEGEVMIKMFKYVERMIAEFPENLKSTDVSLTPASKDLFDKGNEKVLDKTQQETFHNFVARGLFLAKRARPDILPTDIILASRVISPNETDWKKLRRLIKYLNGTRKKCLTLLVENLKVVKWMVDASFAVHPDFKSHTGAVMSMGKGAMQSISKKQKLNTRSSTEAELVAVDDVMSQILWTKLFLDSIGYKVEKNILFQDNKSSIILEENGRRSVGKRNRALNIRYFFVTDQVQKGNLEIQYCPSEKMVADFMTKPNQGTQFREFQKEILGN